MAKQWKPSLPNELQLMLQQFVRKHPEFRSPNGFIYFAALATMKQVDEKFVNNYLEKNAVHGPWSPNLAVA